MKLDRGHPCATVTRILITGTVAEYPTASDDGNEPPLYFHWEFYAYLQEFPNQRTVLDVTPGGLGGNTAILMVSTQNALQATDEDRNLLAHEVVILGSSRITYRGWSTW